MDDPFSSGEGTDGRDITPATVDTILSILQDPIRRHTVRYCASASDRVFGIDDLVDYLARVTGPSADTRNREEMVIELHHHHLPKLAEAKVIEFDPESGKIQYHGGEQIERWIRQIDSEGFD